MNLKTTQAKNIGLISVFVLGSIVALGYSAKIAMNYSDTASKQAEISQEIGKSLTNECETGLNKNLRNFNIVIKKTSGGFTGINNQKISDPYPMLTSISSSIQSCNGYRLKSFCMGSDCDTSISFELMGVNHAG